MRFYDREWEIAELRRLDRQATVAEVKRNPAKFNPALQEEKFQAIKRHLQGYRVELIGLSMADM